MPSYYQSEDLPRFAEVAEGAPELWAKFQSWYGHVFQDGALSSREKALIGLAVATVLQCPYCIEAYTSASLENGSNLEQMTEALQVAAALRAGATLVHGVQMKSVVDKLSM
ncbi:MAG TPA: arsenosugar biosynthesis-associated peroxidase-like protein [Isosphaeraceae bacterium]|jgi:alkylhydroperoxidase/carboxymuconolactone decarboxylase family protein|nr:arsenosugar biosynthesis-associated peroxidase-like protein [Isosphaeraceae bacterium]